MILRQIRSIPAPILRRDGSGIAMQPLLLREKRWKLPRSPQAKTA